MLFGYVRVALDIRDIESRIADRFDEDQPCLFVDCRLDGRKIIYRRKIHFDAYIWQNRVKLCESSLERAMQTMEKATDVAAVREGVELIYTKFLQTLEQNGVKPIPTDGQSLDTDFHEAIALIDAPSEEQKGKILDCVQKGYTLNDKVIRHAKVVIGK